MIAQVIVKSDEVLAAERPDALLLYGDTNTCLGVLAAKRRKIPVFHMEAGNRCFDQRVPEEMNRKIVDHLSDINMPLTEHARRYLLAEGLRPETVIKTGSTMREVLDHYAPGIAASRSSRSWGSRRGIPPRERTPRGERGRPGPLAGILETLQPSPGGTPAGGGLDPPRTRMRLERLAERTRTSRPRGDVPEAVRVLRLRQLQQRAFCVISDSGTITEESALLGFPAVTLREAHERPEGMDAGTLVMSGLATERVLQAIDLVTSRAGRRAGIPPDYLERNVSRKVVQIIQSYTDYVNRTVWRKTASEA